MKPSSQPGVIVLAFMIITGTILLVIALTLAFISMNAAQAGLHTKTFHSVFFDMDSCAEETLVRINRNNNYTGSTLWVNDTLCIIVTTGVDSSRRITITALQGDYIRVLFMTASFFPTISVTSWQEFTF